VIRTIGLLLLLIDLNILDLITTYYALYRIKGLKEANPIAKVILNRFGFRGLIYVKAIALTIVSYDITILENITNMTDYILMALLCLYVGVIANNLYKIRRAKKKNIEGEVYTLFP
jgi:hypothetical protein